MKGALTSNNHPVCISPVGHMVGNAYSNVSMLDHMSMISVYIYIYIYMCVEMLVLTSIRLHRGHQTEPQSKTQQIQINLIHSDRTYV